MTLTGWDHLRALVLAVVLAGNAVYALPFPPRVTERQLREPARARELHGWHEALAAAGIDVDEETLGHGVVRWTERLDAVQTALKTPFRPLFDLAGTNQAWALFASATTQPDRLVVEVDRGSGWEVVFRRLDPCCTWRADLLRYRRIRGVWDAMPDKPRAAYDGLARVVARLAFADFPDARAVRVHIVRGRSIYPWEPPDPTTTIRAERAFTRAEVGP